MSQHDIENLPVDDGLIFACRLDGDGGGTIAGWADIDNWFEGSGPLWVHFDRESARVHEWLRGNSGLTPITIEALLAVETRPRSFRGKRGTAAILRGINPDPAAGVGDMVAIRIWSDGERVITVRSDRVSVPRELLIELLRGGNGPTSMAGLFQQLISRLTDRMTGVIDGFEDQLDEIEATIRTLDPVESRATLGALRREAVIIRRYMAPQREAVNQIYQEPPDWLDETPRLRLRECVNRLMQFIESIDETRERAIVLDDGIANRMAEKMNQNMYILSIVAAIFLPLGFITGLLGINVGGMPGVDNAAAFWITCVSILLLLAIELLIFRRLKWI